MSDTFKYSVEADMHTAGIATGITDYERAKRFYDQWNDDAEVFNVCMYKYKDGESKGVMMYKEEII